MSYTYKCGTRGCRAQVTFKKKIEDFIKGKQCKKLHLVDGHLIECGGNLHRFERDKIRNKARGFCNCDGLPWDGPHRKGSNVWCINHPTGPTKEDYEERYGPCYSTSEI